MIGFFTGFSIIIVMCVAALIIDLKRDRTVIDNFACEYKKMFDLGLVPTRTRRH